MEENDIQLEQVDVGQHKNRSEVDKEKLSQEVVFACRGACRDSEFNMLK